MMSFSIVLIVLSLFIPGLMQDQEKRTRPKPDPSEDVRYSTDVLNLSTNQVVVNVTVTDGKGKVVKGLDKQAFQLYEDDQQQDMVEFFDDTPTAVAVVLDVSGSVIEKDMNRYRNAILNLAYRLHPTDMLAVYTFNSRGVEKIRDYSSTVQGLKQSLENLRGNGSSPLFDALMKASEELRTRQEHRRIIILVSDGSDSMSTSTQRDVERQTFLAGTAVYAIDLVNEEKASKNTAERQASAQTLKQIATESGGRYILPEDGSRLLTAKYKLNNILEDLIDELHSQYTIVYEPNNPRRSGRWRTVRVNLEQSDLRARTRLGYREGID